MTIIGVTGGIGAGKSSVSAVLKKMGARVIDADFISHEAEKPGGGAYGQIVEEFGHEIFNPDSSLDRKRLADIVFNHPEKRIKLEKIVHTQVVQEIMRQIDALKHKGYNGLVVLDVPIPVKHGFLDMADRVWVVDADDETRIKRVMERSGINAEDARLRIHSQLSREEYISLADEVIENNGSFEELEEKIRGLVSGL